MTHSLPASGSTLHDPGPSLTSIRAVPPLSFLPLSDDGALTNTSQIAFSDYRNNGPPIYHAARIVQPSSSAVSANSLPTAWDASNPSQAHWEAHRKQLLRGIPKQRVFTPLYFMQNPLP